VRDARGQLVTTNVYDVFGRVTTQATAGDTNQTWKLYWTGYVNTEENPAGGKRRFYYDDKRRLTFTLDALNHYTATFYDGRITSSKPFPTCLRELIIIMMRGTT